MQATNCPKCGRLFNKVKAPVCPDCDKEEEKIFDRVRKHIEENPGCTLANLAEATDVSAKRIMQYIRDGRLEISKGMAGDVTCERCGKPILRGRYCDSCVVAVKQEIVELFDDTSKKQQKMHTRTLK